MIQSMQHNWHGWIVLDKPLGITSAKAVGRVKKLLKPSRIGHAGTLDPLATGVLPLALGEATKTCGYMMGFDKTYSFTVNWGEERNTDDSEGQVICSSGNFPRQEAIEALLPEFIGEIQQTPPLYSAIKLDGERAYALARQGEAVKLEPRTIKIHDFRLMNYISAGQASFEVTCGKGTYIRALARDMGRRLGCFGYVSALRRTQVGKFCQNHAISLDNLDEFVHNRAPNEWLLSVESALDDILAIEVDFHLTQKLKAGMKVPVLPNSGVKYGDTVYASCAGKVVALARWEAGWLKPMRVFNY